MPWSTKRRSEEHARRSEALSGNLDRPIPHVTDAQAGLLGQTGRPAARDGRAGSRGGAPIWVAKKGWEPEEMKSRGAGGESTRWRRDASYKTALAGGHGRGFPDGDKAADPDGFAVFGRYPKGFLDHVLKAQWLGASVRRDDILHVCSGTLSETERWTVDLRAQARPLIMADGKALPFRAASFPAVMLDPPYSDEYARNLYGIENPRPSWLLKEAARVVKPGGRVEILHVAIPFAPPGCFLVTVWPVTTGVGFRIRALTIYQREQAGLEIWI